MRHDGRRVDELRALEIETDYLEQPHGSVLYAQGKTIVLCTATVEEGRAALAPQERPRLDDGGVRDAAGVDGRAHAARRSRAGGPTAGRSRSSG